MAISHRVTASLILCLVSLALVSPGLAQSQAPGRKPAEVPPKKQTELGLYLTAKEAYDLWQKDKDAIKILDCRTPEEYMFVGHAAMAYNLPGNFVSYQWDPEKKEYALPENPQFVALVQKKFKATDTLLVMCLAGARSANCVNRLAKAGFKKVYNVVDGFEGDKVDDPQSPNHGKRTLNGWKNGGLPWTYDLDPKLMYLRK